MSYLDLFADLEANAGSTAPLDAEALQAGLDSLGSVKSKSERDDERRGKPRLEVRVVGDPEIVDAKKRYFHYLGPALLVNLDGRGMVRSLEFLGVWGGKKNANYIYEVWHYDVSKQKYKYRNLWDMQGRPAHNIRCKDQGTSYWGHSWIGQEGDPEFYAGDSSWISERAEDEKPGHNFLSEFKATSETFFVNLEDGTFARGPQYGMLKAVIQNPAKFLEPLIMACSTAPEVWMKKAAAAITETKQHDKKEGKVAKPVRQEQAVQVAQLVFGLAACVQPSQAEPSEDTSTAQPAASEDPWMTSDPWNASRQSADRTSTAQPTDSHDPWVTSDPWSVSLRSAP